MVKLIIGVVGNRNSGKTTTTSNITDTLVIKGFKVAIIKFLRHKFDLDPTHKDSALLRKTKATTIISTSPHEIVLFQNTDKQTDLQTLIYYLPPDTNVIICESYPSKFPRIPLIFVCRNTEDFFETKERYNNQKPLFITGFISNQNIDALEGIPVLSNKINQIEKAIELIMQIYEPLNRTHKKNLV
ncbi:MAG: molybdopterin-guanine dinucleotide biosynthesis protein B [Promethearchaeota archaeon]